LKFAQNRVFSKLSIVKKGDNMVFYRVVPLSAGFMLTSIVGALISAIYVTRYSASFGFAFFLFFVLMFVASIISMTLAPIEAEFDVKKEKRKIIKD
jgi:formate hydrogenlyase subunit 3/multisubunit Na+/H+ antiporter MnhD subunit